MKTKQQQQLTYYCHSTVNTEYTIITISTIQAIYISVAARV